MVNDPRFRRKVPLVEGRTGPRAEVRSLSIDLRDLGSHPLAPLVSGALGLVAAIATGDMLALPLALLELRHPGFTDSHLDEKINQAIRQESEAPRRLISTVNRKPFDLVDQDPIALRKLPGHLFEDLFADVLKDLGFDDVAMRVSTEIGEVDILGFTRDILGHRIGYVFELKQLGESMRSVVLSEVTRLYGLREGLRQPLGISQGVFVTTTD
ncbi:MAG: restriction endonuclease, partial [Chloroflexi bacterium]